MDESLALLYPDRLGHNIGRNGRIENILPYVHEFMVNVCESIPALEIELSLLFAAKHE